MVNDLNYSLYDIVEMKKPHPCSKRTKFFQIVRVGADIKIRCQGCGALIMIDRDKFNKSFRRVISHNEGEIKVLGNK